MIITAGSLLSADSRVRAIEALEAKAALADRNGLHRTARSWRDMATNLRLGTIEREE
jgi:hypothetical protein